ncbi:hypothetical protein JX266_005409 [Neoarthrinium moseri]|uniref:uncharacterized protein n=1 Tax=Neoarthrinium moseri TaxID=1658444 RepID=UPI001FDB1210|nr:uncharacterized protein JN550_013631 [Neoarthrinium moseri]KAI1848550.1 hypothetical protein JX266_005409 [Neoarthrinium moseri]KAI1856886.1 hypothetical protein JN550_013631 [Neoarthrinium moseri]
MSFAEGAAYNERLMPLARGTTLPDQSSPVEVMMYELWQSMRNVDKTLADEVLDPMFDFMRAQTNKVRATNMGLGQYLKYREDDVGQGLLSALMRFCMHLQLSPSESELLRQVESNCSKHLAVVNDIWSFEKERAAAKAGHREGGVLCSSVSIVAQEASVSAAAAKRTLYCLCREWEHYHMELTSSILKEAQSPHVKAYIQGLEYQMSGNEAWSNSTSRYNG